MRAGERTLEWLERHTSETRSRHAADIFLRGRARLVDRAIAAVYFAAAADRWERYETVEVHLAPFAAGLERCRAPGRVLDLGTGTGGAAAMVAGRHPGAAVVGVDRSRAMLTRARRRHPAPNLSFRRATVLHLPFPDAAFDLVTCVNAVPEVGELTRVTTAEAQVLLASTSRPVPPDDSEWTVRWRACGFCRVGADAVAEGSWELYQRAEAAA